MSDSRHHETCDQLIEDWKTHEEQTGMTCKSVDDDNGDEGVGGGSDGGSGGSDVG